MARTGRPKAELVLTHEERLVLERLTNRRKSAQAMALRARIVLTCATGTANRGRPPAGGEPGDGRQVASAVHRSRLTGCSTRTDRARRARSPTTRSSA